MQWETPGVVCARHALTAEGWQQDVAIRISGGVITAIEPAPAGAKAFDLLLPGMANVHSHAFQRAMVGLTEFASAEGKDNFWSWREVMYHFLETLTPEDVERVARQFYIELLEQGYTAVGEFHYLHNDSKGRPYADPAELSHRIIAAATAAGIHLTHLPVMYETANFGGIPAQEGQRRFVHTADSYLKLLESLQKNYRDTADVSLGVAPHSLRAVTPETLKKIFEALPGLGLAAAPRHIHAAEQEKEVADCLAWSGRRPVQWLLETQAVDSHWCLIHATHMTPQETAGLAASGAVAGLCPTTEANLGDGIFPAEAYAQDGGRMAIGSDSNVCTSPWEELRLMEYAQRLTLKKRNVLAGAYGASVGRSLFERAARGGAQALALPAGQIAVGLRADLVAVAQNSPWLVDKSGDAILNTLIFGSPPAVTDVFVSGRHVVREGRHVARG
ncbi:MAG: formimidoylglutamate deiminase [Proteobacteria bacterium]|nr:formimidoylglutamate deiminase [Pseudomonadota bacterium]